MEILFLSHCVPYPPDKGERIRSHFLIRRLCQSHRVHLVCFGRSPAECAAAEALSGICASVYTQVIKERAALFQAGLRFLAGGCLNTAFYDNPSLRRHVEQLARRVRLSATLVFSAVMAPYAPAGVPYVFDLQDVDSEKWLQYALSRRPGFLYRLEGRRLRDVELRYARPAVRTFLTTRNEELLFRDHVARMDLPTGVVENGVDFDYYDPGTVPELPALAGRRFLLFLGTMDYYPNATGVIWFARSIFPELRQRCPGLEFVIVGRNPGRPVTDLAQIPGVSVTGAVSDTRPYIRQALANVAPLRIARGIQNKVLEALAMNKWVLATPAICNTFGDRVPFGIRRCDTAGEYAAVLQALPPDDPAIREDARRRFTWATNLEPLVESIESVAR
jgi:polysaccharide biosynthesis protein PslH